MGSGVVSGRVLRNAIPPASCRSLPHSPALRIARARSERPLCNRLRGLVTRKLLCGGVPEMGFRAGPTGGGGGRLRGS